MMSQSLMVNLSTRHYCCPDRVSMLQMVTALHQIGVNSVMVCCAMSGHAWVTSLVHTPLLCLLNLPLVAAWPSPIAAACCCPVSASALLLVAPLPLAVSANEAAAMPSSAASTASAASESSAPDAASLSVAEVLSAAAPSSAEPAQSALTNALQHLSMAGHTALHLHCTNVMCGTRGQKSSGRALRCFAGLDY